MVNAKNYPNIAPIGEYLSTTTGSTLTISTSATTGCDGILIMSTGGATWVAFRGNTPAASSNLKVPDGDQVWLQLSEAEANQVRLRLDTSTQVRVIGFKQR